MNKEIEPLVSSKTADDSCQAEIWVVPDYSSAEEKKNQDSHSVVLEQRITDLKMKIESLDDTIERLENSADGIDYAIAAASGVLAGVLDILFVGDFSLEKGTAWGADKANSFLYQFAAREGYAGSANVNDASSFLANKYGASGDITSHPSIFGLVFSIVAAVGGVALTAGKGGYSFTSTSMMDMGVMDRVFRGVVNWGIKSVCNISNGVGSKSNGLFGPINTLFKKSASINTLNANTLKNQEKLSNWVNQSLSGKTKGNVGFNLETELGVAMQLGVQALPVLLNEVVVRAFYFIRRFFQEVSLCGVKSIHDLYKIDWKATLPFGNRTIARMMSVATLSMTTVDMAGAAIEALVTSGGTTPAFFASFALRLNYVGLGRTVIAITTDGIMGGKLGRKRQERIALVAEYLELSKEKIYYKQKDMWVSAEKTKEVIEDTVAVMAKTDEILKEAIVENKESLTRIQVTMDKAEEKNPGLKSAIKDTIKWE